MCLAKQEDRVYVSNELLTSYHLIVRGMKQRLGNVPHAHLGEKVALASLYRIHRFAQSVGNIIHREALCRQSQHLALRLAQGYAFFLFPLVARGGIFKIATLTILLHDDMSRLIGSCQRYGAEGKPYSSIIRKENRGEVMMNQSALTAIGKMKVVRDGIVQTVAHRQFIEKIKPFLFTSSSICRSASGTWSIYI